MIVLDELHRTGAKEWEGKIDTLLENLLLIAEMGAYVTGEIHRLCELVTPKYGIITSIGTAHLETFGSAKNIQKG